MLFLRCGKDPDTISVKTLGPLKGNGKRGRFPRRKGFLYGEKPQALMGNSLFPLKKLSLNHHFPKSYLCLINQDSLDDKLVPLKNPIHVLDK